MRRGVRWCESEEEGLEEEGLRDKDGREKERQVVKEREKEMGLYDVEISDDRKE